MSMEYAKSFLDGGSQHVIMFTKCSNVTDYFKSLLWRNPCMAILTNSLVPVKSKCILYTVITFQSGSSSQQFWPMMKGNLISTSHPFLRSQPKGLSYLHSLCPHLRVFFFGFVSGWPNEHVWMTKLGTVLGHCGFEAPNPPRWTRVPWEPTKTGGSSESSESNRSKS